MKEEQGLELGRQQSEEELEKGRKGISCGIALKRCYFCCGAHSSAKSSFPTCGKEENEEITSPLLLSSSSSLSKSSLSSTASNPIQAPLFLNHTAAYQWLLDDDSPLGPQDYFLLQQGFEAQVNQAYCGVASATTLLNSFRNHNDVTLPVDYAYDPYSYATQEDVFDNACVVQNVFYRNEDFDGILAAPFGLGMAQVAALLECFFHVQDQWQVQLTHVDPSQSTLEQVRDALRKILGTTHARVLVNFDRHVVQEEGGGHWSPVAAYNPTIDAFLILDVAKYKCPATWIPARLLYQAMGTTDKCGVWNFPTAQQDLPEQLLYPETSSQYRQAMKQLGCQPTWRGFVSVQEK
eukprot:scaffold8782_cov145-Amphora_coffeaeformis.AAC.1